MHLLTGFLGSGKTTLLATLLGSTDKSIDGGVRGERLAVLVNDVASLALDQWLCERVDEDVWALPSGCLCCSLRGELYAAVERVVALGAARVVLETSGLADPAPIQHALGTDRRLGAQVHPAGVVAVVDASRAEDLLATQPEALVQLASADRIVLTKTDLTPQRVEGVLELLAAAAPGCEVRIATHGEIDPEWLLEAPALARMRGEREARAWLHHHAPSAGGGPGFSTRTVELEQPADVDVIELWLRLVTQLDGPRLLRVKLLVEDRATGAVFALQSAGRLVSPPRRLALRPTGMRGLRLVLVERGLEPAAVEGLLESLHAAARGERYGVRHESVGE